MEIIPSENDSASIMYGVAANHSIFDKKTFDVNEVQRIFYLQVKSDEKYKGKSFLGIYL